jgi:lipopolysaccharide transport system ATP-binding protein
MQPDILLADEVLAVGDLEFQERCLTRVAEASRQGITVLFVSHDMAAISRLCSRALMLNAGGLVKDGTTDEVVELYQEAAWTRGRRVRRGARNDLAELLFVKLMSPDGRELGAVRWTDDVCLTYGFRVDQPGVFIRATCDVFARGVLAFRTLQPEEVAITEAGTYTASVRIPGGLLAETIYSVNAAIDIRTPEGEHRPVSDRSALSFRVYDAAMDRSLHGTWRGGMPGIIAPSLEWSCAPEPREADVNV